MLTPLADRTNKRINAIARLSKLTHRSISRIIGKSPNYTLYHLQGKAEWTFSDITLICKATGYTTDEILTDNFTLHMPDDLTEDAEQ